MQPINASFRLYNKLYYNILQIINTNYFKKFLFKN